MGVFRGYLNEAAKTQLVPTLLRGNPYCGMHSHAGAWERDKVIMISPWKHELFGDVCGFVRGPFGGSLKKNIFKPEGYAVYEQQHAIYNQFTDIRYFVDEEKFTEMSRFELFSGELIMSCSGTMGKIAIVPEGIKKGIINQALLKLSPKKELLPVFLKLWMQSRNFQEQIALLSQGAAIKNMASVKTLKEIKVPIPTINEQKRIVAILDQAFTEIEKARANAEQNLKNARALFESYLQQVFSRCGGRVATLGEISECVSVGYVGPTSIFYCDEDIGVPFLRSQNVRPYGIEVSNVKYVTKEFHENIKKSQLQQGDLLFVRVGVNRGDCCVLRGFKGELNCANIVFARPRGHSIDFLEHFCNSRIGQESLLGMTTGSAQGVINTKSVAKLDIPLPPKENQLKIVDKINKIKTEIEKLEVIYGNKVQCLDELKKSILQKAFTGELTKEVNI